jgi:hypothetical protein
MQSTVPALPFEVPPQGGYFSLKVFEINDLSPKFSLDPLKTKTRLRAGSLAFFLI